MFWKKEKKKVSQCSECMFSLPAKGKNKCECRRFPVPSEKVITNWCGEFK